MIKGWRNNPQWVYFYETRKKEREFRNSQMQMLKLQAASICVMNNVYQDLSSEIPKNLGEKYAH